MSSFENPLLINKSGIYNLTDGIHPTFAQLEDAICKHFNKPKVKSIPLSIIKLGAFAGDVFEMLTRKSFPINKRILSKITNPLTFNDDKARTELGWKPHQILNHINKII